MVENERVLNSETLHLVPDVPELVSTNKNWCGYTSLAMVMQHYGLELTPQDVFNHIHKDDPPAVVDTEYYSDPVSDRYLATLTEPLHPTLHQLAVAAEELSGGRLQAEILDGKRYEAINRRREQNEKDALTPFDLLDAFLVGNNAPCIVRKENHNVVVAGVDQALQSYVVHDPAKSVRRVTSREHLDIQWGHKNPNVKEMHPGDTRYLMLVIRDTGAMQRRRSIPRT